MEHIEACAAWSVIVYCRCNAAECTCYGRKCATAQWHEIYALGANVKGALRHALGPYALGTTGIGHMITQWYHSLRQLAFRPS